MPDLTPGVASALSPLVRRIVAPNPGPMTGPGTNTYLVGIDEVAVIEGTEWGLEVLHTPGHAPNHLCFLLEEERVLFSGDHILGGTTTVVHDLAAYMASLERLRKKRVSRICPGHGDVIDDPKAVIQYYIDHRNERERQILATLAEGPAKIKDIVKRLYSETPEALHDAAGRNVHVHLVKLRGEGKVTGRDVRSTWQLAS